MPNDGTIQFKWGVMYSVHGRLCLVSSICFGAIIHYETELEIVTPCMLYAGQALVVRGGEKGSQPAEQLSPPSV